MFAYIAAVLFGVAAILSGSGTHVTSAWFAPITLICLGLASLALYLGGVGPWARRGV